MTTSMHRLQISLPREQMDFLSRRARGEGVSVAEFIRRLVEREAQATTVTPADIEAALSLAGIGASQAPLQDGIAVSAQPDLYLYGPARPPAKRQRSNERRSRYGRK